MKVLCLFFSIRIDYLLKSYMNMCQTCEDEDMMTIVDLNHYSFDLYPFDLSI